MKITPSRLKEIIREEVARMNEDEDERSPEKRVFDYVVNNYITDKKSDKTDAANIIIQKIRRKKDLSGSLGPDILLRQVKKTMIETFPKEKLPRSWRPKEELEEVDVMSERIPPRSSGESPPESPPDLQKLKTDAITAIKTLSSAQGKEGQIIQFLTNLIDLINNKRVDTPAMMTHLTRAQDEAGEIAR